MSENKREIDTSKEALFKAVNAKDAKAVDEILSTNKSNIETTDKDGNTPLMLAADSGDLETVRVLVVRHKADIEAKGWSDFTPLLNAVVLNKTPNVVAFLLENKANINAQTTDGSTVLHAAVTNQSKNARLSILRLLLNHNPQLNLEAKDGNHHTPLLIAAMRGDWDVMKELINHGADIHAKDKNDKEAAELCKDPIKFTLLHSRYLADKFLETNQKLKQLPEPTNAQQTISLVLKNLKKIKNEAIAELCKNLEQEKPRNIKEFLARLQGFGAAFEKNHEAVAIVKREHDQILSTINSDALFKVIRTRTLQPAAKAAALQKVIGEDPSTVNTTDYGDTPLMVAIHNGDFVSTKVLVEHKADLEAKDSSGNTALLAAARKCHLPIIKILVAGRAKLDVRDNLGFTPLMKAAVNNTNSLETIRFLLDSKADINAQDNDGDTALHHATRLGGLERVQLLLKHNADPNIKNSDGETPIICAAKHGHLDAVKALVRHGAKIDAKDRNGKPLADILREHGANIHIKGKKGEDFVKSLDNIEREKFETLGEFEKQEESGEHFIADSANKRAAEFCEDPTKITFLHALYHGDKLLREDAALKKLPDSNDGPQILASVLRHLKVSNNVVEEAKTSKQPVESKTVFGSMFDAFDGLMTRKTQEPKKQESKEDRFRKMHGSNKAITELCNYLEKEKPKSLKEILAILQGFCIAFAKEDRDAVAIVRREVQKNKPEPLLFKAIRTRDEKNVSTVLAKDTSDINTTHNGETPLTLAVTNADIGIVNLLLEHKANIERRNEQGDTALLCAARHAYPLINILLENKADINAQDSNGDTALQILIRANSSLDIIRPLLEHSSLDIRNPKYEMLAILAAQGKRLDLLEVLIKRGAEINTTTKNGDTVLHILIRANSSLDIIRPLLEHPSLDIRNPKYEMLAILAAQGKRLDLLELLIKRGAKINVKNGPSLAELATNEDDMLGAVTLQTQITLWHSLYLAGEFFKNNLKDLPESKDDQDQRQTIDQAVANLKDTNSSLRNEAITKLCEHLEAEKPRSVKELLARLDGFCAAFANDPHVKLVRELYNETLSPSLFKAVSKRDDKRVDMILSSKSKSELNAIDSTGRTPLMIAIENEDIATIRALIKHKPDLEARDSHSRTALVLATDKDHLPIIKILVAHGANIEARDSANATPLITAAANKSLAIMDFLLESKADVNARTPGETVLHIAATLSNLDCVRLLLTYKPDLKAINEKGETPLLSAAEWGHADLVELLIRHGADINAKDKTGKTLANIATGNAKALCQDQTRITFLRSLYLAENASKKYLPALPDSKNDKDDQEAIDRTLETLKKASETNKAVAELYNHLTKEEPKNLKELLARLWGFCEAFATVNSVASNIAKAECQEIIAPSLFKAIKRGPEAVRKVLEKNNSAGINAIDDGGTPLQKAAERGDLATVQVLVGSKADIEAKGSKDGYTPLIGAALLNSDANVVAFLLENGANINAQLTNRSTALHAVLGNSHPDSLNILQLLLTRKPNLEIKDTEGQTPLLVAAKCGKLEAVKLLIRNGATIKDDLAKLATGAAKEFCQDQTKVRFLHSLHLADNLLEKQPDATADQETINQGLENLKKESKKNKAIAELCNHLDTEKPRSIKELLARLQGFCIAFENVDFVAAKIVGGERQEIIAPSLSTAIKRGPEALRKFLQKYNNYDINATCEHGHTHLTQAASSGDLATAQVLVEYKADINARRDKKSYNPLIVAALHNHQTNVVAFLLENKADINAQIDNGDALHAALGNRHANYLNILELLVTRKPNLETRNAAHETPLLLAARKGQLLAVALLIRHGADITATDKNGNGLDQLATGAAKTLCQDQTKVRFLHSLYHADKFLEQNSQPLRESKDNPEVIADRTLTNLKEKNKEAQNTAITELCAYLGMEKLQSIDELLAKLQGFRKVFEGDRDAARIAQEEYEEIISPSLFKAVQRKEPEDVRKILSEGKTDVNARNVSGQTPLMLAIDNGDLNTAKVLAEYKADINIMDNDGNTVMHFVARANTRPYILQFLLEHKPNLETRNAKQETPLILATKYKNFGVLGQFIKHGKIDINAQDNDGNTVMHIVARENIHSDFLQFLLAQKPDLEISNAQQETPLILAAKHKHLNVLEQLVRHGAKVDVEHSKGLAELAITDATKVHDYQIKIMLLHSLYLAKKLSEEDPTLNQLQESKENKQAISNMLENLSKFKMTNAVIADLFLYLEEEPSSKELLARLQAFCTVFKEIAPAAVTIVQQECEKVLLHPLFRAVQNKDADGVRKILRENKLDINMTNSRRQTPLMIAIDNGDLNTVTVLLEHKADIEAVSGGQNKYTPLISAVGSPEIMQILLEHKANINGRSKSDETALHIAAQKNASTDAIKVLLRHNPNLEAKNTKEETPLLTAAKWGRVGTVELLVKHGANINATAKEETPLLTAAKWGRVETVELLIRHGADINATANGESLAEIATGEATKELCGNQTKLMFLHSLYRANKFLQEATDDSRLKQIPESKDNRHIDQILNNLKKPSKKHVAIAELCKNLAEEKPGLKETLARLQGFCVVFEANAAAVTAITQEYDLIFFNYIFEMAALEAKKMGLDTTIAAKDTPEAKQLKGYLANLEKALPAGPAKTLFLAKLAEHKIENCPAKIYYAIQGALSNNYFSTKKLELNTLSESFFNLIISIKGSFAQPEFSEENLAQFTSFMGTLTRLSNLAKKPEEKTLPVAPPVQANPMASSTSTTSTTSPDNASDTIKEGTKASQKDLESKQATTPSTKKPTWEADIFGDGADVFQEEEKTSAKPTPKPVDVKRTAPPKSEETTPGLLAGGTTRLLLNSLPPAQTNSSAPAKTNSSAPAEPPKQSLLGRMFASKPKGAQLPVVGGAHSLNGDGPVKR